MSDRQGLGNVAGVAMKNDFLPWRSHQIANFPVASSIRGETGYTVDQLRMREMSYVSVNSFTRSHGLLIALETNSGHLTAFVWPSK